MDIYFKKCLAIYLLKETAMYLTNPIEYQFLDIKREKFKREREECSRKGFTEKYDSNSRDVRFKI